MEIHGTQLNWTGQNGPMDGYLVKPVGVTGKRPAVVVIHEIFGIDAHIRDVCDRFAREGYVALGPMLYQGELREALSPENIQAAMGALRSAPPEVQRDPTKMATLLEGKSPAERAGIQAFMTVMNPAQARKFAEEVVGTLAYLRSVPEVDPHRTAALGFCFGGGQAGLAACLDPALRAAVIFYGMNPPPELVPQIKAAVLGLYGGEDHRITDTVPQLVEETRKAGVRFSHHVYPGAMHAFFNNTRAQTYNAEAAKDAWERVLRFFGEELR